MTTQTAFRMGRQIGYMLDELMATGDYPAEDGGVDSQDWINGCNQLEAALESFNRWTIEHDTEAEAQEHEAIIFGR